MTAYVPKTRPPTKVPEARTLLEQMKAPPREPIGTRIRLTRLTAKDQEFVPLERGDEGVVMGGNEASLWVRFDRGYDIVVVPGIDQYVVVVEEEKAS